MKRKLFVCLIGLILGIIIIIIYFTTLRTYTVIFDSVGGTWIKAQEVRINKQVVRPKDPILDGYTFKGWYLYDEEYDFDTLVTKDIVLVAKWEAK